MRRDRYLITTTSGFLLGLACLLGAGRDESVPSDPVFVATLIDGSTVKGRIARLDSTGVLELEGPAGRASPLDQVVSLVREGGIAPPSPPEGALVLFPDGDRLLGIIGTTTETALQVLPGALGDETTSLPLDHILGVVTNPPTEIDRLESLLDRIRDEPRETEVLLLANGDRQTGSLLGVGAEKVEFQTNLGPMSVPRSAVVALGFDPATVKYPRPEGTYLELTFTDGSRLGIANAQASQGRLRGRTRFGLEIRPELKSISSVHVRGPAIVYLSEQPKTVAQYVGYLGTHPGTFGRDHTWDGHAMKLAGQPIEHGLGTLPRTLLAYRLDPKDRRFQARVGLDDRAGDLSGVVFRVLVDENEKWASPPMTRRDPPRAIDIDVSGGRFLILITEFGDRGDIQDSADWAGARLIRR